MYNLKETFGQISVFPVDIDNIYALAGEINVSGNL